MIKNFMKVAFEEAYECIPDFPVGCVAVCEGEVVAKSGNKVHANHDPTHHAEILVIKELCERYQSVHLDDKNISLYVTLEPCRMCAEVIYRTGIKRVYFGVEEPKYGGIIGNSFYTSKTDYYWGFMEDEIKLMMSDFAKEYLRK